MLSRLPDGKREDAYGLRLALDRLDDRIAGVNDFCRCREHPVDVLDAPEVDRHQHDYSPGSGPRRKSPQVDGKPDPGSEQGQSKGNADAREDTRAIDMRGIRGNREHHVQPSRDAWS